MRKAQDMQTIIDRQSDIIRSLVNKQKEMEKEMESERETYRKDVSLLMRVLIAALMCIPGRRVTLSRYTPRTAEFKLDENISGEMIVILGNTH